LQKIIIAAVSKNNVIGSRGKTPWFSKEEITHFKKTTSGFPVIMGRKTWESIGKPLSNRVNIILTHNENYKTGFQNVVLCDSVNSATDFCSEKKYEKIFFIGGGEIFKEVISNADELIISEMNFETEGDVYFPIIDKNIWNEISVEKFTDFEVHCYIRK
jgi:dihydrofolate reductase